MENFPLNTEKANPVIISFKTPVLHDKEKESKKQADQLILANKKLKKTKEYLREYMEGMKEIVFMTSHRVRQPIAQILGISNLLDQPLDSQEELRQIILYVKNSVMVLDSFTKELVTFVSTIGSSKKK